MTRLLSTIVNVLSGLAVLALVLVTLLIAADSIMRTLFSQPMLGVTDIVELAMACLFFFALPGTFLFSQHVVVDVVDSVISRSMVSVLISVSTVTSLAVLAAMLWSSWPAIARMWEDGEATLNLDLPMWWGGLPILTGLAFSLLATINRMLAPGERPTPPFADDGQE